MGGGLGEVLILVLNAAALWTIKPTDTVQHGSLACPIWPDDGPNFSFLDIKRNIGKGGGSPEIQRNVFDLEQDGFDVVCGHTCHVMREASSIGQELMINRG